MTSSMTSLPEVSTDVNGGQDSNHGTSSGYIEYLPIGYLCIGSIGVFGNTMVLWVIFSFTSMRRRMTNMFIINQTLVDLVVSLILTAAYASKLANTYDLSAPGADILCRLWLSQAFLWGVFMVSTYNLVAVTIERYMKVVHPIVHRNSFTKRKALIVIAAVWIWGLFFTLVTTIPTTKIVYGACWIFSIWPNDAWQRFVGLLTLVVQFFIPVTVMAFAYIRMILVLRSKAISVTAGPAPLARVQGEHSTATAHEKSLSRMQKNLLKTLMVVTAGFVLCWSWNQFFFLLMNLGYPLDWYTHPFYHFSVMMAYTNSCINPIIYLFKYQEFQKGAKQLLCDWKKRKLDAESTLHSGTATHNENSGMRAPAHERSRQTDTTT